MQVGEWETFNITNYYPLNMACDCFFRWASLKTIRGFLGWAEALCSPGFSSLLCPQSLTQMLDSTAPGDPFSWLCYRERLSPSESRGKGQMISTMQWRQCTKQLLVTVQSNQYQLLSWRYSEAFQRRFPSVLLTIKSPRLSWSPRAKTTMQSSHLVRGGEKAPPHGP